MKKDAERLQASLQRAELGERIEGKLAPLVQTATLVSSLAEPLPPPPNQLLSGRHRFLTEAARIRASKTAPPRRVAWKPAGMRLAGALVAIVLVLGIIFGAGYAAADSLPGEPLYALKLATETARMQWTADPEARAELTLTLVAERLDEITGLLERRQGVDEPITNRAKEQLAQALLAVHQLEGQAALRASQRLANTLQVREQALKLAAGTVPQAEQVPVLELLREMNRIRQELRTGQGEPNQEQPRQQPGAPPAVPAAPEPSGQPSRNSQRDGRPTGQEPDRGPDAGPGPRVEEGPARPQQPDAGPGASPSPQPDEDPGSGPGPQPGADPGSGPGSQPDEDPGSGPGSQPGADPGSGSGSQPDEDPGSGPGSQPGADPGSGSGSQPDEDPGSGPGSQPDADPGSGSGSQTDEDPGSGPAPQPDEDPGSGSGSQPDEDPGSGAGSQPTADPGPPEEPGSQPSQGTDTDLGSRKP